MDPHKQTGEVLKGLDLLVQDQHLLERLRLLPTTEIDRNIILHAVKLQTSLTNFLRESIKWLREVYIWKVLSAAAGSEDLRASKAALQEAQMLLRTSISDDLYLSWKRSDIEPAIRRH